MFTSAPLLLAFRRHAASLRKSVLLPQIHPDAGKHQLHAPAVARFCQGSTQSQPQESSKSVEYKGELDTALYTILQQHFLEDEHAAVKRVAAEAAMLAKLYCGDEATVSVWDLARLLLKVSGVQAGWNGKEQRNQFGLAWTALYQDPAAFCRVRYHQVQLQPAFQQQLLARMAEVQPNPQHITPHPPQVLAAMERYKARLAAMGYKQTNSPPADSVPLFLPAPATAVPIPEVPKQQHSTQPSVAPSIGHEALYDQQGIEHHTKEENVEVLKTDLDQRPTQARPCQGSPQLQPQESSKSVEYKAPGCEEATAQQIIPNFQGELDTALYSVLQQHFLEDEHAAVKRVAAEAAMLAKLHRGGDTATVSTEDLDRIFKMAGVQAEQFDPALSKDSAAFCKLGSYVQVQPAFEQQLMAGMAELKSNPQHITPHPPQLLAAMKAYRVILGASSYKSKQDVSSSPPADSIFSFLQAPPRTSPIPEIAQQQHSTQPSADLSVGIKALLDQQGTKHHSKEDNVELLKADPDHRPTQARPCQGSPQSQPLESSKPVEFQEDVDTALYTVLQQHFWGDEHAAVKRVAAEAAMLAKLCGREVAAVSRRSLAKICNAAGVQCEHIGATLLTDTAAFTKNFSSLGKKLVQLQPSFEQLLLARMAEMQSNPQQITPHPPKLLAAMEAYKAIVAAGVAKSKRTNSSARPADSVPPSPPASATSSPIPEVSQQQHNTQPSAAPAIGLKALYDQQGMKHSSKEDNVEELKAHPDQRPTLARPCQGSPQSQPHESSISVEYEGKLDAALYTVLQQHFWGDEHAAVKRVAAEAAMLAKLYCGDDATVQTTDLDQIFKTAGVQAAKFGTTLFKDSAAFCRLGVTEVQLQPAFEQQLLAIMAELQSNPQHITPHPPQLLTAMEAYKAWLAERGSKGKQTNSPARPADSAPPPLPTSATPSPNPQVPAEQREHSTQPSAALSTGLKALLDQQGTKHHSEEDTVEMPKADLDQRPTRARPCQGSPQSQPQESSKSVEYKGELDTALYSVLQQHFLEDEHAAVKRVAAEAAMLAKLHGGGDTATVSTEDLDRIFKMAGVQAEQFDPALSKDSAAFCKLGSYVQVQPAFEQQLMAGMAELKSNPQHITPHPPHLLAAMKAYRVILGASSFKGERTNSSSPPADSIFSFLQAPPRTSPIPEIAQQQHSTQPSAAPSIGHEALLDQQGTKHHSKEDIVELLKADPDHRPQQAMPRPKESLVHAAKDVERPLTFAQRHRAEANHLARKLSLFQADTQQGSTDGGKPPPFIELQMKIGPGFSPSYLPYTKDAPSQVQPGTSSSIPSPSESTSASQDDGPEAGLDEEAASVISLLPSRLQDQIQQMLQGQESTFNLSSSTIGSTLTEIHIDEGRPVKLRFRDRPSELLPIKIPVAEALSHLVGLKERFHLAQGGMQQDPDSVGGLMGARRLFGSDGRMALPGMLHRVSGMRDSMGNVYALTYRVGRHQPGLAGIFSDLLAQMCARRGMQLAGMNSDSDHEVQGHGRGPSINSILIMGPPGCGKTTLLRDMARLLSTDLQQEVNVVDTSSEIAGHSFVPHPCIGNARRFLVPDRQQQHQILLEAVQNHGPEVVIVDEIGTEQEVAAVSTISQRGVKMVGTAHGLDLQSLIKNPVLVKLVGGIQNVTYGDETAKKRGSYKVSLARRGAPVFSTLIEVLTKDTWRVHTNVAESVDKALASGMNVPNTEVRRLSGSTCLVRFETPKAAQQASGNMED